ncbi:ribosomal lysine N-methyltransferase 4-like isoform X1 [Coffea arabica]|uniref:Ribosomal lysine N-methyltransferase 4-like isoform X1 n=1 Tax=Coffea arabica TaxID=13443 RepID=A0A6P6W7W2_COFAR
MRTLVLVGSANFTYTWCPLARRPFFTLSVRHRPKLKFSTSSDKACRSYIDEECDEDFLPWLEQKACTKISSTLSIGKSAHGRALYASKPIQAGDCILRVPYSVQLAPDNLPPEICSLFGDEVSSVSKVALLLLHEQKMGQKSEWAPYIRRLPQPFEMHNTIFWSDDELEMIRQSVIYQETIKQRNHIEKQFMAIKPATDQFPQCFEDVSLKDFAYAHALVLWTRTFGDDLFLDIPVTSRAWESSRGVSMIPFADFLNHDGTSEACLMSHEGKQLSEVIAERDYSPGDQVLISYGKFSNSSLVLDFGFTVPYNIYDQAQVELNIPQHYHLFQMKLELLQRFKAPAIKDVNEFSSSEKLFTIKEVKFASKKGRGIPQSFRAFACVLCSNAQELSDLESEAAQSDGRLARSPLKNKSREIEAHELIHSKITEQINEYDACIKSLGPSTSQNLVRKHALRRQMAHDLLSGELRVLKSASAWLKKYCATLLEG